jgi:asparagine synthetase B (glutamine-hydrolysing)
MSRIAGIYETSGRVLTEGRWRDLDDSLQRGLGGTGHGHGARLGPAGLTARAKAAPPLASAQRCIAVIDGRILNRGVLDAAESDAALLIELYRRHGFAGALERLIGDFAIALYDEAADRLFLGRDRIGVKPLYTVERPDFFAFASRPRGLLALPGVPTEINERFAALFAASLSCHSSSSTKSHQRVTRVAPPCSSSMWPAGSCFNAA